METSKFKTFNQADYDKIYAGLKDGSIKVEKDTVAEDADKVPAEIVTVQKPHEVERKWYLIDATDKTLGRLSSKIASVLRGKHKPIFTPYVDCGDYVVVC